MRADMIPGAAFPDYELSDHTAKHRKLSELQEQQPTWAQLLKKGIRTNLFDTFWPKKGSGDAQVPPLHFEDIEEQNDSR